MHYEEALRYIHAAPRFKGAPSLHRMRRLCALLGNPQLAVPFVHVAGTNGKGSIAHMVAAGLRGAGYRTGLFISPYVISFRERIQVDGALIPRQALAQVASQVREAAEALAGEGLYATEFELVTACGLLYFAGARCEVAVLEVGLGGRFDATNVIPPPLVAVIGKIALDHTAILGDTLEKIASEKCGIIKGGQVVSYPAQAQEALAVIMARCAETGATLHLPAPRALPVLESSLAGSRVRWRGEEIFIPLGGAHQVQNAAAALQTLEVLGSQGYRLPAGAVGAGIGALRFPGRLERVCQAPPVWLDGAHNPDGMEALARALAGRQYTVVFSAMQDKDYAATAARAAAGARRFIACGLQMPRAADPALLAGAAAGHGAPTACAPCFAAAYAQALEGLLAGEEIVVCGSLYLAAEARAFFCPPAAGDDA